MIVLVVGANSLEVEASLGWVRLRELLVTRGVSMPPHARN